MASTLFRVNVWGVRTSRKYVLGVRSHSVRLHEVLYCPDRIELNFYYIIFYVGIGAYVAKGLKSAMES